MIISEKQGFKELIKVFLPYYIYCLVYALFIMYIEERFGDHIYKYSGQIGSVFGIVIAFFINFRMSSAYDRWWEARKIAGELINNSRALSCKIIVYIANQNLSNKDQSRESIEVICNLIIKYIKQLTAQIYKENNDIELNKASIILLDLTKNIEQKIDSYRCFEKNELMQFINTYYDIQGKLERINNTPFLKIYSAFARIIILSYIIMIPVFIGDIDIGGEKSSLEYISLILVSFISSIFLTLNKLSNLYGEPFKKNNISIPLGDICNKIEAEINELLYFNEFS